MWRHNNQKKQYGNPEQSKPSFISFKLKTIEIATFPNNMEEDKLKLVTFC